jgi:hypothetical protein
MVQLSATRCNCIAILWVSLVSFAAIIVRVASPRVFIVVSVYIFRHGLSPETFGYTLGTLLGLQEDCELSVNFKSGSHHWICCSFCNCTSIATLDTAWEVFILFVCNEVSSVRVAGGSATNHNKTRADRRRKNAQSATKPGGDNSNKEDLENKGSKKRSSDRCSKKKVLEEANSSKLRRRVQVRVEDCLHHNSALRSCKKDGSSPPPVADIPSAGSEATEPVQPDPQTQESADELKEQEGLKEEVLPSQEEDNKAVITAPRTRNDGEVSFEPADDKSRGSSRCSAVLDEKTSENEEECNSGTAVQEEVPEPSVIVEDRTSSGDPVERHSATNSQDDDDGPLSSSSPFSRMEIDSSATALLRFPDDRSDSGVSSLRSGSGDERSGSRSSALSSSDEPPQQQSSQLPPPLFVPSSSSSNSCDKLTTPPQEPVRVWRDPSLLLVAEPHVRHINSVQHQTLLMSHPPPPAATAPSSSSAPAVVSQAQALALAQAHYPPVVPPPPPLLSPHPLHHHPHAVPHHLPPPGLYSQLSTDMLWNKRYPPLPVGTHLLAPAHPAPEEILAERERERVFRYVTHFIVVPDLFLLYEKMHTKC